MKEFVKIGDISFEVIPEKSDVVPNLAVDINKCYQSGVAPPESGTLEYDSDENGENVSFEDASPIIPDKIAAIEKLQYLESKYKEAKDLAAKEAAAEAAQKMAAASDTLNATQPTDNQPSETQA